MCDENLDEVLNDLLRQNEILDLFTYRVFDGNVPILEFYDCVLSRDFGRFKKGEHIDVITFNLEDGQIKLSESFNFKVEIKTEVKNESSNRT